jgi:hypothetical protein
MNCSCYCTDFPDLLLFALIQMNSTRMIKAVLGMPFVKLIQLSMLLIAITACEQQEQLVEKQLVVKQQTYSFVKDIKPVLDKKCLACHACYDAPCQLKMESSVGVERGASKLAVYDGARLKDATPTRLYIDAQTTEEWRSKGFYSVLSQYLRPSNQADPPLMQQMLEFGHSSPLPANKKVSQDIELGFERNNFCPAPGEFVDYRKKFPHGGMPLAVSGLDDNEYQTLTTWLKQGAQIDAQPITISQQEQQLIKQWESWLNRPEKRSKLLSRYLYEHLYLGHLYLSVPDLKTGASTTPTQFYHLIRSFTPAGQAPVIVPTLRANDDPGKAFFYRLVPIIDTIVQKTHITYRFDLARLKHYQQVFDKAEWQVKHLPGYGFIDRSNPFITFKAIPAKLRYQFLLDDAMFFVRSFIRGPVCRGQIATNVIRDQFWVMFENPDYEPYSNQPDYQASVNQYLGLPGEKTSIMDYGREWLTYQEDRNLYLNLRQREYQKMFPKGATLEHLWDGDSSNDNAFLTVFRHHNSASVTQGWQGEIPLTVWLMGYPLLERTYYELVVGFDVFGNVSHQAQTRLYFDLIRNGSETNFLRFMPPASRKAIYNNWYQSSAKIKTKITYHDVDMKTPTQIVYTSEQPKQELLQSILHKYPLLTGAADLINRCQDGQCEHLEKDAPSAKVDRAMRKIAAIPASKLAGIKWLPEVSFVRINVDPHSTENQAHPNFLVYSLLRNRRHSNVAFILGESLRYQEEKDTLTILPMPVGSYPNLIFQLNLSQVDEFVTSFSALDSEKMFDQFVERWGVGRMSDNFWSVFHSFKDYMQQTKPLEAGIYDMNRYEHW